MSMRVERQRTSAEPSIEAQTASQRAPATPAEPSAARDAGKAELTSRYEATRRKGPAGAEQARIEAARSAVSQLAAKLSGHGIDVEAFAARFGSAKYANHSKAQVASAATYAFMKEALTKSPELADRAIEVRLTGASGTAREIVKQGCAGQTGLAKYAAAERALRTLSSFDAEQQQDIAGLIRAGASFDSAVAEEKKALRDIQASAPRPKAVSLAAQRIAAVKQVQAEASAWKQVSHHMNTAIRSVPKLTRGAELVVGAAAATGTAGSLMYAGLISKATSNPKYEANALRDAEAAGGYMAGELTEKIDKADRLFVEFSNAHIQYAEQSKRLERAIQSGDYPTISDATGRMQRLTFQMKNTVKTFDGLASQIAKMNSQFNAAAAHAAAHIALSAVSAGLGLANPHAMKGVADAIEHGLKHAVQEAAIIDAASKLAH